MHVRKHFHAPSQPAQMGARTGAWREGKRIGNLLLEVFGGAGIVHHESCTAWSLPQTAATCFASTSRETDCLVVLLTKLYRTPSRIPPVFEYTLRLSWGALAKRAQMMLAVTAGDGYQQGAQ